jgi:hypothetical protein
MPAGVTLAIAACSFVVPLLPSIDGSGSANRAPILGGHAIEHAIQFRVEKMPGAIFKGAIKRANF